MKAEKIFERYAAHLEAHGGARVYDAYTRNELWTPLATLALMKVGFDVYPSSDGAARKHSDQNEWGKSEYLGLDVVRCNPKSWGPPLFIAEHENSMSMDQIEYCAWKLLCVQASVRVLVAYWGHRWVKDFNALEDAVARVCKDHRSGRIVLIGGKFDAKPKTAADFRDAHELALVGAAKAR